MKLFRPVNIVRLCVCVIIITFMYLLRTNCKHEFNLEKINTIEDVEVIKSPLKYVPCPGEVNISSLIVNNTTNIISLNFTDELMLEAENDMEIRRKLKEEICKKYELGIYSKDILQKDVKMFQSRRYREFFFDTSHNFSYCPVYKASSSTWLFHLLHLANYTDEYLSDPELNINKLAKEHFGAKNNKAIKAINESATKFIIVRHPFERLVSAYRDKLEHIEGRKYYYDTYGKKIKLTRKDKCDKLEPTFSEFVKYLLRIDVRQFDEHWTPINMFCSICVINYDIIGHVETLQRDQLYIINKLRLNNILKPKWKHKKSTANNTDITKLYFKTLTKEQIEKLYDIYKLDFELFDYSYKEYFQLN